MRGVFFARQICSEHGGICQATTAEQQQRADPSVLIPWNWPILLQQITKSQQRLDLLSLVNA
jgi:hypothetical protein